MNEQIKKDYETLKNWEQKLLDQFSPTGAIKGLEVQGNNLIISFESEVPGDFQLTTGAPIQAVGDLLAAQERIKDAEKADAVEKEREAMLAKVREMSMSLPNIQLNSKEIAGGYRACLSEMIHFLTSPHDQQ